MTGLGLKRHHQEMDYSDGTKTKFPKVLQGTPSTQSPTGQKNKNKTSPSTPSQKNKGKNKQSPINLQEEQ